MVAFATYTIPDSQKTPGTSYKWRDVGWTDYKFSSEVVTGKNWETVNYVVVYNPSESEIKSRNPTDGYKVIDSWTNGLCNLKVLPWQFVTNSQILSTSCDEWSDEIQFDPLFTANSMRGNLSDSNNNNGFIWTPLKIANGSASADDKIYAYSAWWTTVKILYVAWDKSETFTVDLMNPTIAWTIPNWVPLPAWWNHIASHYSYSTTPAIPTKCNEISTNITSNFTFSPSVDPEDICNIGDIERSDGGSEYVYVNLSNDPNGSNSNDRTWMCIDGVCTPTILTEPFMMKNGSTPVAVAWHDYYDAFGHTINKQGSSAYSNINTIRWNPTTVWLWNSINKYEIILRANNDWLYLYPAEATWSLKWKCSYKWTLHSDVVLWWFGDISPNTLIGSDYNYYNNDDCSGTPKWGWKIVVWYNPTPIMQWDYCIEVITTQCDWSFTLYQPLKHVYAELEWTIESANTFKECLINNTVLGSPASTNIDSPECIMGALKVAKAVSWWVLTGFAKGSGVNFVISITNDGKNEAKQIDIMDILTDTNVIKRDITKSVLVSWTNCPALTNVTTTEKDAKPTLAAGLKPGKTCDLVVTALFSWYWCYTNKATAKQDGMTSEVPSNEITVCTTWMKLELMKELVWSVTTWWDATFRLTIKNTWLGSFPKDWTIKIEDLFTSWLEFKSIASNADGCVFEWSTPSAWTKTPLLFSLKTTKEIKEKESCTLNAVFKFSSTWTETNTWCITSTTPNFGNQKSCSSASVSGSQLSGSCTVSGTVTSGTLNATCTVTPWGSVSTIGITALGQAQSGTTSPFAATFTISTGSSWQKNISLGCMFTLSNGFTGTCAGVTTEIENKNTSNTPTTPPWDKPSPKGDSPSNQGGSKWWWGQCKGWECKKKECQASNFGPWATVPFSAGIVNNDPNVAMEWVQFRDELPAGMAMYEWTATIDGQVVKQGNKNWARGRVELTPDLVWVTIPPLKTLNINYVTKIDQTSNFGSYINPGANLFECDDNGNKVPTSWNSSPNPNGNSDAGQPQNKCGWWASNAPASSNNFQPQSFKLPGAGTGAWSWTVATWWNDLRCEPKLYDIAVTKKVLSEKIEVGKSLKFEVTIKNEWLRTVSGLVIQDMFSGVVIKPPFVVTSSSNSWSVTTNSTSLWIPQWYYSTANTGMFNLMSWWTLSGWQSVTIIIDTILSGTKFENKIQACNYKDILDPDSDSCNGFDKWEDDNAMISWWVDTSSLWDKLWFDTNGDGLQSTWEKGIADSIVQLVQCGTDVVVMTGKTSSDGIYGFSAIAPWKYAVRFDVSSLKWFVLSPKNVWTDDLVDSDSDKIDGKYAVTECITLTGGQNYLWHDLWLTLDYKNMTGVSFLSITKKLVSSGMIIWWELLFEVTVINEWIMWSTGIQVKDKFIGLTGLKIGTWKDNLKAFTAATNDVIIWSGITLWGKPWGLGATPCTGAWCPTTYGPTWSNQFIFYVSATLTSGSFSNYVQLCNYDTNKEGVRPPTPKNIPCDNSVNQPDDDLVSGSVLSIMFGDFVWNDTDKNWIQNTGEQWVWGIDLELYACNNTWTLIKKTKSAWDGSYKFDNLTPWSYIVKALLIAPNDKYAFTQWNQWSDRAKDSNIKTLSSSTIAWTDCINLSMWSNDTSIDIGLIHQATDLQVTKTTMTPYVTSWDIVIFMVELKNIGQGVVKQYTLVDKLPVGLTFDGLNTMDKITLSHWMSWSTTWDSKQLSTICGYPANGWSITSNSITGYVPSSSIGSNIWTNQSCIYRIKAKVISNTVGQGANIVWVSQVNEESNISNNTWSAMVNAQPACDLITVNPWYGDAPFELMYSVNATAGTVRLLDASQNIISSSLALSGKQSIANPWYYYLEYIGGAYNGSGVKCLRPVVVKELTECTAITATPTSDTQYNVTCAGNYASSYKIDLYKWTWTNKQLVTSVNGSNWIVTLSDPMSYTVQCVVNGSISYSLDKLNAYNNPTTDKFQCPYKTRSNGTMCAVDTLVAPLKTTSFDINTLAQLPDPIEYCTPTEVSSAICVPWAVSAIMVKNPNSCQKELVLAQPDLLVTKSADKGSYWEWESITWTINVKNIWGWTAKGISITDTMINALRIDSYTDIVPWTVTTQWSDNKISWNLSDKVLAPNQEFSFKIVTKLLNANLDQVKNTVVVWVLNGNEITTSNNTSEFIISKHGNSTIGDLVWNDTNKNGVQDPVELWIPNLQVQLIGCNSVTPLYTTFTNTQGAYSFNQIWAWSYRIMVQLADKYRVSPRNIWSSTTDSNVDQLTNMSECFTLSNGQVRSDIDAWLFIDPTIPPQNVNCGNNQIQPEYGEQCDGNAVSSDATCQNCQIIKKNIAICWNGTLEVGEDCEKNTTVVPNGKTCYECKWTENSVCGDGKVSWWEECDTMPITKDWFQCIGCIYVPNGLAVCGNGKQEVWEACDLGSANGSNSTIPSGVYAGKKCTIWCNVINTNGWVVMTYEPPSCLDIDPPSVMQGEYFPFRWNIDTSSLVTSCSKDGQIIADSLSCVFDLYNGKWWTTKAIKSMTLPCRSTQDFAGTLMSEFNKFANWSYGRSQLMLDSWLLWGVYGEYKIRLKKIDYQVCNGSWTANGSIAPFNTFNDSYDETICEYNFTVSRPYLMQVWWLLSTNVSDSLFNFYGFSSNEWSNNILAKYGVRLESVTLDQYAWSTNMNYLVDTFVEKYNKLAVQDLARGNNAYKVPGKDIYVFRGSLTYNPSAFSNTPKTIIVEQGDLKIDWNIRWNTLFVVPNGNIIVSTPDCNTTQTIEWILVTKKNIVSDRPYVNNNLSSNRCNYGNLEIRWLLVAHWLNEFINARRSVLDGWFINGNKKDAVLRGASVLITSNDQLFTVGIPWLDEFSKEFTTLKR